MTFSRIMRAHQVQGPLGFLGDRRNDQCGGNPDNQRCGDDHCDDGQDTAFQLQLILEELDERLHHLGEQPGNQEGEQGVTQYGNQVKQYADDDDAEYDTCHPVERKRSFKQ